MRRLLPRGLTGQMIVVTLLALVAAQGVSVAYFLSAREAALEAVRVREIATRTESLIVLLTTVPPAIRGDVLAAVNTAQSRFEVEHEARVSAAANAAGSRLLSELRARLEPRGVATVRVLERWLRDRHPHPPPPPRSDLAGTRHRRPPPPPPPTTLVQISMQLPSGEWLNADLDFVQGGPERSAPALVGTLLAAVAIVVALVLMVRRLSRPLSELADNADRLGRGQDPRPLAETGPDEVRRTIRAFNTMTERLRRFIEGQTRMLAAISHDLKTPITSLRIRAEFVEDGENREKMLATLEDMRRITQATLAFARDDVAREPERTVDVAALVDSICDDVRDVGGDVTFRDGAAVPFLCRPNELKRAVRNLVENAVSHGLRAQVTVEPTADAVVIVVEDEGPGIMAHDVDRVFEPFVRLEESRSIETGGIGLGLSIARSVVQGHGGSIELGNRRPQGLRVEVTLPRGADEVP
ncbi:MAG: ATP-binding protein [Pseudomonadota bacterium]